jgi:hypothetical protein
MMHTSIIVEWGYRGDTPLPPLAQTGPTRQSRIAQADAIATVLGAEMTAVTSSLRLARSCTAAIPPTPCSATTRHGEVDRPFSITRRTCGSCSRTTSPTTAV